MELILFVSLIIVIFWCVAVWLLRIHRHVTLEMKKDRMKGRIVKISKSWLATKGISGDNFGKIVSYPADEGEETGKIQRIIVSKLISKEEWEKKEQYLIEEKQERVQELSDRLQRYRREDYSYQSIVRAAQDLQNAEMQLISVPSEGDSFVVPIEKIRILPKNYDYLTGTIVKPLQPKMKGGVKRKRNMGKNPKFFRYIIWASVTILVVSIVLDAAWHINDISNFVVNTLILHKQ